MQDIGRGTYLVVGNNGNMTQKFLNEREPEDVCHQFTHRRLGGRKIS